MPNFDDDVPMPVAVPPPASRPKAWVPAPEPAKPAALTLREQMGCAIWVGNGVRRKSRTEGQWRAMSMEHSGSLRDTYLGIVDLMRPVIKEHFEAALTQMERSRTASELASNFEAALVWEQATVILRAAIDDV